MEFNEACDLFQCFELDVFHFKLEQPRIYVNNHLLVDNKNATLFVYINWFSGYIYLLCPEGWSAGLHLKSARGDSVAICSPINMITLLKRSLLFVYEFLFWVILEFLC